MKENVRGMAHHTRYAWNALLTIRARPSISPPVMNPPPKRLILAPTPLRLWTAATLPPARTQSSANGTLQDVMSALARAVRIHARCLGARKCDERAKKKRKKARRERVKSGRADCVLRCESWVWRYVKSVPVESWIMGVGCDGWCGWERVWLRRDGGDIIWIG